MQNADILVPIRLAIGFESAEKFAEELGYSNPRSYKNIEAGHSPITNLLIKKICSKFNINPEYFQNSANTMFLVTDAFEKPKSKYSPTLIKENEMELSRIDRMLEMQAELIKNNTRLTEANLLLAQQLSDVNLTKKKAN